MIICDKCKDVTREAQYTSLAIVTHDNKADELESFEHDSDLCQGCRLQQRQAIESALGVLLTDVSSTD